MLLDRENGPHTSHIEHAQIACSWTNSAVTRSVSALCCPVPCCRPVLHERVLVSVYRGLLGSSECPPIFGSHWEAVGFQGNDPSTDVRGAGMFGLLLLLAFVQQRQTLANQIFKLSTDAHQVRSQPASHTHAPLGMAFPHPPVLLRPSVCCSSSTSPSV